MEEDDFVNILLKLYHVHLNYHMFLVVVLSEFCRRTPFTFLEDTIEIRDIVETTMIANLYNRHSAIGKQSGSMTKTNINDIFRNTLVCTKFEETAECCRCHGYETCKCLKPYLLTIMRVYIFLYFLYPTAICRHIDMSKRT